MVASAVVEQLPPLSPTDIAELTDDQVDKQNALKQAGADLLEDGKLEEGLAKLSDAILVGCASALLYCRRAGVLMQLGRWRAVINDCTAALAVNPDSGKAFKLRARANAKLELWEEAHRDFQTGLNIDFDDQTEEESKLAAGKAKSIRESAVKERVQKEKDEFETKLKADKEAYDAAMKARAEIWTDAKEAKYQETCKKAEEEKKRKEAKAQPGYTPETAASKAAAKTAADAAEAAKLASDKAEAEKRLGKESNKEEGPPVPEQPSTDAAETEAPSASGYPTSTEGA